MAAERGGIAPVKAPLGEGGVEDGVASLGRGYFGAVRDAVGGAGKERERGGSRKDTITDQRREGFDECDGDSHTIKARKDALDETFRTVGLGGAGGPA